MSVDLFSYLLLLLVEAQLELVVLLLVHLVHHYLQFGHGVHSFLLESCSLGCLRAQLGLQLVVRLLVQLFDKLVDPGHSAQQVLSLLLLLRLLGLLCEHLAHYVGHQAVPDVEHEVLLPLLADLANSLHNLINQLLPLLFLFVPLLVRLEERQRRLNSFLSLNELQPLVERRDESLHFGVPPMEPEQLGVED